MERMKQPDRRTLICHLVDGMREHDSWAGETHIQKCVLFLQDLVGVPMGYEFVLHLHGPFSFELRSELALMRARLQLDVEPHIGYGPSFTLGTRGKLAMKAPTRYETAIKFVAREISSGEVRSLERLSTAFFLQQTDPSRRDAAVAAEVNRLKPHISIEQARKAVDQVNELRQRVDASGARIVQKT